MLENLQKKLIEVLTYNDLKSLSFDGIVHEKIISNIKKKLFSSEELNNNCSKELSVLVRRSLAQFLGYQYWNSSLMNILIRHVICFLVMPFYVVMNLFKWEMRKMTLPPLCEDVEAILISIPPGKLHEDSFQSIFQKNSIITAGKERQLTFMDIAFLLRIIWSCKKIILYPELIFRVTRRIAQYSAVINNFRCKTIVNMSSEGSPWSSILTGYCRENKIEHVSIMHGIRLYSSQMAFSEFDIFYVWGQYHIEQFRKMYVEANEFVIYGNPIHQEIYKKISGSSIKNNKKHSLLIGYDYPIMLLDNDNMFDIICEVVNQLESDWEVRFRPHPRYIEEAISFLNQIKNTVSHDIIIDNPQKVSFLESIINSDIILSCYSNVLTDAWIAGRKCIYIDNPRVPLQEFHYSKNIKIYRIGDDICEFLHTSQIQDDKEWGLKNRFSYNFDLKAALNAGEKVW